MTGAASVSDESSPYRLVVRDAAGAVLSSTGVAGAESHVDYEPGHVGEELTAIECAVT